MGYEGLKIKSSPFSFKIQIHVQSVSHRSFLATRSKVSLGAWRTYVP